MCTLKRGFHFELDIFYYESIMITKLARMVII